jgi:uncharacterized cupin superfamily protein
MRRHLPVLFVGLCLFSSAAAQEAVPVAEEPQHFLVFENPYLRVIDARFPPGYVSLYHVHAEDNVPVAIRGGSLEIQRLGEQPVRAESDTGSVTFAAGGFAHRVSNRGESLIRYIDAEIVATPPAGARAKADSLADHQVEMENERVRIYRLKLVPGATRVAHQHAHAVLEVIVTGDTIRRSDDSAQSSGPGAFRWFESGLVAAAASAGPETLEIIEIEWK